MRDRRLPSFLIHAMIPVFCWTLTAFADVPGIKIPNGDFEVAGKEGLPLHWSRVGDPTAPAPRIALDGTIKHAGSGSVAFENTGPAMSVLESSPLTLTVGHLYRLSGWVRTERAVADPTSRYPTAVAATLTMASFPFTNHAPVTGGTQDWRAIEVLFFATTTEDRVRLHLGLNGTATGRAWFDDVTVEEVNDIGTAIPLETVKWYGPAFRYQENGWIIVHCEGEPYERGYQYGHLVADELVAYMSKLAVRKNPESPRDGWNDLRTLTDALMLRKFDQEYLEEMRGIADGAAGAGASYAGRTVDFLDVVTVNSVVDIGQMGSALGVTPHPLSGRSFAKEEEEAQAAERLHKCSSFLANGPATRDGKIVFGQLFMWNGYTGVHWDVICDVVPSKGHRLVYETFPGGIHSGADFYINDAGIMIGETTVMQTPFNAGGTPQSSRIRKAAQYASSIDDVVRILTTDNNGLYTNDWLIGDTKTSETAILLLGTKKHKLWRSTRNDFPGGTTGFYWSVNNAKDPDVRTEYVANASNAPYDVVYGNVNRDLAFTQYYQREKGKIDGISAVNIMATSPINRPHACDGKITTSEMASHMMFLAHYGKVTLREKVVEKGSRLMQDLPDAIPHLTLGYTVINPVYVADQLKGRRVAPVEPARRADDFSSVDSLYTLEQERLWTNTVYPASDADNWFVSGTAAYWQMLHGLPPASGAAATKLKDGLADLSCRLTHTMATEGGITPLRAQRVYDRYNNYLIPRIRGTYALHQMRMQLGNDTFLRVMNAVHGRYRELPMTTAQFITLAEQIAGTQVRPIIMPWIGRDDLPDCSVNAVVAAGKEGWHVTLRVRQRGEPFRFRTTVALQTAQKVYWRDVMIDGPDVTVDLTVPAQPERVLFNAGNDIPVKRSAYATFSNYFDDFSTGIIVYGTTRRIEANHTAALKWQTVLADQFVEHLPRVVQDAEVSPEMAASHDLLMLGGSADNALVADIALRAGLVLGRNQFTWQGKRYVDTDDGLFVAFASPYNPSRTVYLMAGNSALEQYHMTKRFQPLPSWAIFKGETVVEKGYHGVEELVVDVVGAKE